MEFSAGIGNFQNSEALFFSVMFVYNSVNFQCKVGTPTYFHTMILLIERKDHNSLLITAHYTYHWKFLLRIELGIKSNDSESLYITFQIAYR